MIEEFEAGALPPKKAWYAFIDELKRSTTPSTKEDVKRALIDAVKKRIPDEHFGVFLSGGVDSSVIAAILKQHTDNFTCYSVGIEGSSDLEAARIVAETFNLNWKHRTHSIEEVEALLKESAQLFGAPSVVACSVSAVVIAAARLARDDNVTVFFGGLGSEEIFAGYQRHLFSDDVNSECWEGLCTTWDRDLTRDAILGKHLGISVNVPFLDTDLIRVAMGIPGSQKVSGKMKKVVLREIAEEIGVPQEIAWRRKKAAQYGSGFDRHLDKLAKKAGTTKFPYVRSL